MKKIYSIVLSLFCITCLIMVNQSDLKGEPKGKGKKNPKPNMLSVSGDVIGNGPRENITLEYVGYDFTHEAFEGLKTGTGHTARARNQPIFVHYFDYNQILEKYTRKFRCVGNFGKKEPLIYKGPWVLYDVSGNELVTIVSGDDVYILVEEYYSSGEVSRKDIQLKNYPNPFNPTTTINYSVPKQSNVTLKVYDILGKEVSILVNNEQPQGNYEVEFDGSELTSGIYFYTIRANNFVQTKKMLLMK